jgi:hypothetical protein
MDPPSKVQQHNLSVCTIAAGILAYYNGLHEVQFY